MKTKITYDRWKLKYLWSLANAEELYKYKKNRNKLPVDLAQKRYDHIQEMIADGSPKRWIARLYKISPKQLYRILSTGRPQ